MMQSVEPGQHTRQERGAFRQVGGELPRPPHPGAQFARQQRHTDRDQQEHERPRPLRPRQPELHRRASDRPGRERHRQHAGIERGRFGECQPDQQDRRDEQQPRYERRYEQAAQERNRHDQQRAGQIAGEPRQRMIDRPGDDAVEKGQAFGSCHPRASVTDSPFGDPCALHSAMPPAPSPAIVTVPRHGLSLAPNGQSGALTA
ncbi:hypothetical protein QP162_01830 [Sphingomonas aurantiaca]|uniref:hypothetical protein n=1 Tax=Sphingomonas aurantiaca TaxID=185949 RepID=UPI002FE2A531